MPSTGFHAGGVEVDHGDRVGIVERDVGDVVHGIDGDRVRSRAISRTGVAGHADRQPKVDRPHLRVAGRVDHRDAVAIGVGDQQVLAPESHTSRVQTGR